MFKNKECVYCKDKGFGDFISYGINAMNEGIVKFDDMNDEENEFGYNVVDSTLLKPAADVYEYYRLSSVYSRETNEKLEIKDMVSKNFSFKVSDLTEGNRLAFRMVEEVFGFREFGEIIEIKDEVRRKRNYKIVLTKDKEFHLLKRK